MENNTINIENNKVINPALLRNVEQPRLAATVIKLREVYTEVVGELVRAKEEYGDESYDRVMDRFITQYVSMTSLITNAMASVMECDIVEAIHEPDGVVR